MPTRKIRRYALLLGMDAIYWISNGWDGWALQLPRLTLTVTLPGEKDILERTQLAGWEVAGRERKMEKEICIYRL